MDNKKLEKIKEKSELIINQKVFLSVLLIMATYLLFNIGKYWYADVLFAEGKLQNDMGNYSRAREKLTKAIGLSSKEALYYDELSDSTTGIALSLSESGNEDGANQFAETAIGESKRAVELSPVNLNIRRNMARLFIRLSGINSTYLFNARDALIEAVKLAPTDAKLFYNLALTHARLGEIDKSIEILEKTIEMKSNYRDARFAHALLLVETGEIDTAREEFIYILENINPEDELVKLQLEEL